MKKINKKIVGYSVSQSPEDSIDQKQQQEPEVEEEELEEGEEGEEGEETAEKTDAPSDEEKPAEDTENQS